MNRTGAISFSILDGGLNTQLALDTAPHIILYF